VEISIICASASGTLLTGQSASTTLKIRRVSDGYCLDWVDGVTFKAAASCTNLTTAMDEVSATYLPGEYKKVVVTDGWLDGYYQAIAHYDDATTVLNFSDEKYVQGGVEVDDTLPTVSTSTSYSGSTFKALIATHLNRSDLTTQIVTFCDMAVKTLEREGLWFQITDVVIPTVPTQSYVALPTDFVKQIDKEIGEGLIDHLGYSLKPVSYRDMVYLKKTNTTAGDPCYFSVNDVIDLNPTPSAIKNLTFSYYKYYGFPSDLVINVWTSAAWDLTFWAVMEEAWRYLGNTDEMTKAGTMKLKRLGELQTDGSQRMAVGNLRATRF
jgi:hypothetical protein